MKYAPLLIYLRQQAQSRLPMTFRQIEQVIGRPLPASARKHRPWWANDARGHAHAGAWLEAGFRTEEVDMTGEKLVFVRRPGPVYETPAGKYEVQGMEESMATYGPPSAETQHPMIGALKGLLWIDPSLDLTKPALDADEWEQLLAEKYGKD